MAIDEWQLGLIVTFLLAHLLIAYGMYRLSRDRQPPAGAGTEADRADGDGEPRIDGSGVVACPECGTENDRGYRYCRACVTELPGSITFVDEKTPPRRIIG